MGLDTLANTTMRRWRCVSLSDELRYLLDLASVAKLLPKIPWVNVTIHVNHAKGTSESMLRKKPQSFVKISSCA